MQLKVNSVYEKLIPPLTASEFNALKESIKVSGQQLPIVVNSDFEILDGHHRNRVCIELGIEPKFEVKHFEDKLAERLFVVDVNLSRRQLNSLDVVALSLEAERIHGLRAKQRLSEAGKIGSQITNKERWSSPIDLCSNEQTLTTEPIHAREIAAEKANVSETTFFRAKTILEKGSPEIQAKVRAGELTVNAGYIQTKARENVEQIKQLTVKPIPEGKYRCIVIDPPWPIQKIERDLRPNQIDELDYPIMSIEEISKLPILEKAHEEGCHVYLWTTHKFLPDALKLFDSWGVKYECLLTWVKNVGFTPFSWMYNTEHVLFGRIGSLKLSKLGMKLSFDAAVTKHSEKPEVFFERVIQASPEPRLEMFARKKRDGFVVWGNQV